MKNTRVCQFCSNVFDNREPLLSHIDAEHPDPSRNWYPCLVCSGDVRLPSLYALEAHLMLVHNVAEGDGPLDWEDIEEDWEDDQSRDEDSSDEENQDSSDNEKIEKNAEECLEQQADKKEEYISDQAGDEPKSSSDGNLIEKDDKSTLESKESVTNLSL